MTMWQGIILGLALFAWQLFRKETLPKPPNPTIERVKDFAAVFVTLGLIALSIAVIVNSPLTAGPAGL